MSYLLDTHIALWFFNGDNKLPKDIKEIILDERLVKFVSMASVWEVAIKGSKRRLDFPCGTVGFLRHIDKNGFILLDISEKHLVQVETLPFLHSDPFDRLLIAAAMVEPFRLLTADSKIIQYNLP